jgi:transposase
MPPVTSSPNYFRRRTPPTLPNLFAAFDLETPRRDVACSCRRSDQWGASTRSPDLQGGGDIDVAEKASGTTLTELHGVGALTAGKILGRLGDINRFRSAAAFASHTGTAPIEVSSGDVVRHRVSRAGDRQLNYCLHVLAIAHVRHHTPPGDYYLRKRSEGKNHKEAMRRLKRRLPNVVYQQMRRDAERSKADPGGHSGAALPSRAAG